MIWGATLFCDELTGEFGNGLEKASVDDCGLLGPLAGNWSHPIFGVLQHYRDPIADIARRASPVLTRMHPNVRRTHTLKTGNRQDDREAGERGDRNESPDTHAVHRENLTMKRASTQRLDRVTSPFPGFLHRKIHHIHCPGDFRDVYGGINSDSPPYDAISDVFLALPPVPVELHALRLHLACSGRLF
jgi:hypothetical protein